MQVILFDGVCNLCNNIVRFIIRRDTHDRFRFAALQSDFGQELIKHFNLSSAHYETIVLYDSILPLPPPEGDKYGKIYFKSEAVIKILKQLPGWKWITVFKMLPRFLRDFVYDLIAKSRYKIFGKRDSCMVPSKELKDKFLIHPLPSPAGDTNAKS